MNRFQPSKMLARVDEERPSLTLDELTFQLCQLEAALEFRIGDVPASQIIRAATRRLELQRREIEALRTASETSASDTFNGPFGTVRTGVCNRCFSESHVLSQKRGICIRCAESENSSL